MIGIGIGCEADSQLATVVNFDAPFLAAMPAMLIERANMAVVHYEGRFRNIEGSSSAPRRKMIF